MLIKNRVRRGRVARSVALSGMGLLALVSISAFSPVSDASPAAPASGQGAAVSTPTEVAPYTISWSSEVPIPAVSTVADMQRLQAGGDAQIAGLDGTDANLISVAAATPNGFILQHPGIRRTDYIYDSDAVYQGTSVCTSTCQVKAQVKVQLHQVAIGGSSHTWELKLNMSQYSNAGGLTWTYWGSYWCGVNVAGGSDTLCTNGAAPSGVSMTVNSPVNKPWGATNGITVFPMVTATTQFSNGVTVSTKFRGWDTTSAASTTKLKATSGTGA